METTTPMCVSAHVNMLEFGLRELASQVNASHTFHQIIYSLREILPFESLAVILKDEKTDNLVIANRFNISEEYARSFSRSLGIASVGGFFLMGEFAIFHKDENPETYQEFKLEKEYATGVSVRLAIHERPIGYLVFFFKNPWRPTDEERRFLSALGHLLAVSIHYEEQGKTLANLSRLDSQSGLLVHTFFFEKVQMEVGRSERYGLPMTLALMDLDNYRSLVNLYGREKAEKTFLSVAAELRKALRDCDLVCRYGCDELAVALLDTDEAGARIVLERFQKRVSETPHTDQGIRTSLSIGAAARLKKEDVAGVFRRLGIALHDARCKGEGGITFA